MFERIIVGVDAEPGGGDAVELAERLLPVGGELILANVYLGDPEPARGPGPSADDAARTPGLELLEGVRRRVDLDARLESVRSSSVGRGLHELAESEGANLLVIGSCRRGLIGRVLVGDDTRDALNGAPCAVAVAPSGYAGHAAGIHAVGVGYNASSESEHALGVARELAAHHGARLAAFEAVSLAAYLVGEDSELVDASIPSFIAAAKARIAKLDGVEPHAAYGPVVDELAEFSNSVDLLVVGSRGYGPVGRLVHSSTSQQLARVARCPLLVLTRSSTPLSTG